MRRITSIIALLSLGISLGVFPKLSGATAYHAQGPYRLKDSAMVERDGVFHVYAIHECPAYLSAAQCDRTKRGFVHMTSTDLKNWTEVGYILPPGSPDWKSFDVWAPTVVESNGLYHMFYTAVQQMPNGIWKQTIAEATSSDLYTWTDTQTDPVFSCESLSWSYWDAQATNGVGLDCRDPFITWDDAMQRWIMVVSGRTRDDGSVAPWIPHPMVIGTATSTDLVNWTEGPLLTNTIGYVAESSHVFKHDTLWYLAWSSGQSIQYATSTNPLGPYQNAGMFPGTTPVQFASEELTVGTDEYFSFVRSGQDLYEVRKLTWNGTVPNASEIEYGNVTISTTIDDNRNGLQDIDEPKLNAVPLRLYRDNGDGQFDSDADMLYQTLTSGQAPWGSYAQPGLAISTTLLPGSYWVAPDVDSFASETRLHHYVLPDALSLSVTPGQSVTMNFPLERLAQTCPSEPESPCNSVPAKPELISPSQDDMVTNFNPAFTFRTTDPDADRLAYEIEVDTTSTFSSPNLLVVPSDHLSGTWQGLDQATETYAHGQIAEFTSPRLTNGIQYWRVRAVDPFGSGNLSDFSDIGSFTTPPELTMGALAVHVVSSRSATISWTSSNPGSSNAWIMCGDEWNLSDETVTTTHVLTVSNLPPNSSCMYGVWTTDIYGQTTGNEDMFFETPPDPVTTISNVHVSATNISATITWTTNEPASSVVRYGATTAYGFIVGPAGNTLTHSVTLYNLSAATQYHFQIQSSGSSVAQTSDATFMTDDWVELPYPFDPLPILRRWPLSIFRR